MKAEPHNKYLIRLGRGLQTIHRIRRFEHHWIVSRLVAVALVVVAGMADAQVSAELFALRSSDISSGDQFGFSVAMKDDNFALVGSPNNDSLGTAAGKVTLYSRTPQNDWQMQQSLRASDGFAGDRFGFSVSILRDVAAVGAPGESDNGHNSGAVYVFSPNATTGVWVESEKITAGDGDAGDAFGSSVYISGNTLFISATGDDDNGSLSGSVYYYKRDPNSGSWNYVSKITPADGATDDRFGDSIVFFGDVLLIGAPGDDDRGANTGSVYVYIRDALTSSWPFSRKLTANESQAGDRFGSAVDLSFTRAAIGAPGSNPNANTSGAVYVFTLDSATGGWVQDDRVVGQDSDSGDAFGSAVAITANLLIVGAPLEDNNAGINAGSAYLFDFGSPSWQQRTKIEPRYQVTGDFFGLTVAARNDLALIGAPEADGRDFDSGSAYVFELASRYTIGMGAFPGGGGWMQERLYTRQYPDRGFHRLPWSAYNAANGETRPALCDLDGDNRSDNVFGLGTGGSGYIYVELDTGFKQWLRIPWPDYNAANGETFVACGDVDNDGYDEIIAGLGSGGQGYAYAFDDFFADYAPINGGWLNIGWDAYSAANGAVHPSIGDLDGDPYEEVVLGTGASGYRWYRILDDADNDFVGGEWYQAADTGSILSADHEVWPAVCHNRRIVLGASSSSGSGGGGLLNLRTRNGGTYWSGWASLDWVAYDASNGSTRPVCGDLNLDGKKELLVGLGTGGGGYIAIFGENLINGPRWEKIDWGVYNVAVGSTWPAAR